MGLPVKFETTPSAIILTHARGTTFHRGFLPTMAVAKRPLEFRSAIERKVRRQHLFEQRRASRPRRGERQPDRQ